ncbi:MAG: PAS domain-containing protein [Phycisphaerae bacterium]|nr:PAS domain-containing protein [Phycisphaerae bacterium]
MTTTSRFSGSAASGVRSLTSGGVERTFGAEEIIVSKTDPKGRITYANDVFLRVAEYQEHEVLGKPHNLIRHPDMPRCVFKFMWDTIQAGHEIFAYVVNQSKNGNYYWVLAHVTPTFDTHGSIIGYHSNRRSPKAAAVAQIKPVYALLRQIEQGHRTPRDAWQASLPALVQYLADRGISYEEFVFSLADPPESAGRSNPAKAGEVVACR